MLQTGFASNPRNGPSARSCAAAPIAVFLMLAFLIAVGGTVQAQIVPAGETQGPAAIPLTADEREWLARHREIRLAVDPARPPYQYIDNLEVFSGIASDYVRRINEALGTHMQPMPNLSRDQAIEKFLGGDLDVIPCVVVMEKWGQRMLYTIPYLTSSIVIVTREDAPFISNVRALTPERVAVLMGYAAHSYLETDYPESNWVLVKTTEEGLEKVSKGKLDAFVGDLAAITYATQSLGLKNLKVAATTPYKLQMAFGVRKEWPELVPLLNRVLREIPEAEKNAILNRWVNVRLERTMDWRLVGGIVGSVLLVAAAILTVIVISNRKLAREALLR
ncbi:MAG TPA: transporter substrate-binding domain-containing protein, partial [Desulfobacterales bacterium]|nr:transporter substrate-binding domain-containing protein [Desulfobacterales bacterium]